MEEDANKETEKTIAEIKKIGKDKGSKVVEDLLNAVTQPQPVAPAKS
jgi:V-type H+-transporting ATPase subunit G